MFYALKIRAVGEGRAGGGVVQGLPQSGAAGFAPDAGARKNSSK